MRLLRILTMDAGRKILSLLIIIIMLSSALYADKSTAERINKHKEWLKKRNQSRINLFHNIDLKEPIELANLWRFDSNKDNNINKSIPTVVQIKPSINDVYPLEEPDTRAVTVAITSTTSKVNTFDTTTIVPMTELNITKKTSLNKTVLNANDRKTYDILNTTASINIATVSPFSSGKKSKQKIHIYPRWSNWSKWSACSRSCGDGVKFQQRKCINRNSSSGKRYLSNDCVGIYRRYQLCNEQTCPYSNEKFRALQCSYYNGVDFQGQKYIWEPYIKDDAECELNCKPVGMKYFATLNTTVIDGTMCYHPAEYYRYNYQEGAVCVNGICKAIHTNGIISGLSVNSGAVGCGGLLCRPITGIFTRNPLPDEAYVHVTTIPAGASNISITELKNSINLLVLRTESTEDQKYVFNGDNNPSNSGSYEAVGAAFDYHRIDGLQHTEGVTEWITCTGPIRESLELMIFSKSTNPGIKYEYLLPITSESEENEVSLESDGFLKSGNEESSLSTSRRRRPFHWKVVSFSTCTRSCGGGTQTPIVKCVRENPLRYYSQRRCTHSQKPLINENLLRCNTQPCPAFWRLDDWSECRCHQNEGYREREISCVQELASGIVIHVDNSACMEEKPLVKKPCDCPKSRRRTHARYRLHGLSSNMSHAQVKQNREKAGSWLMSDWNQYCSAECGTGVEYRTIFCDRSKPNTDRCDSRATPEITRGCDTERPCETGEWFSGPWSPCNGNCFNLTRSRQVLCIQNQLIVDNEDCGMDLKPQALEKCSHEEVEYCGARWHYSEWTDCTKTCDGGTQKRTVKCLEYDEHENILKDSLKCRYSLREPIYRSCNTHTCDDAHLSLLQNDISTSCVDGFANCQWAVKAKLCNYDYYQKNCCYSCGLAG